MNWLLSPNILLAGAIAIGSVGVATYHFTKVSGARNEGIAIGTGGASIAALESAKETAKAEQQAEDDTLHTLEPTYWQKLCAQSASCRSREKYK